MNDYLGIFTDPGKTLAAFMEKKNWIAALTVILVVTAILFYLIYPIQKEDQAKFVRESKLAERLSEEQLENLDKFTLTKRATDTVFPMVFMGLSLVMAAFFIYLFFKMGGVEGSFVHFFSGVANASLIDCVLGAIVRTALVLTKKTTLVTMSLAALFPNMEFRSLGFMVVSQLDVFTLWYLGALAAGIAVFAKISWRKSATIALYYFIFKVVILVGLSYLSMKIVGM